VTRPPLPDQRGVCEADHKFAMGVRQCAAHL